MGRSFSDVEKSPIKNINQVNNVKKKLTDRVTNLRTDDFTSTPAFKPYSSALYTIDFNILNFIKNNIKPMVYENGNVVNVPILYATPERWAAMRMAGYLRDNKSKLIYPVVMVKRGTVSQNQELKIPRFEEQHTIIYAQRWDRNNRFDDFAVRNKMRNNRGRYVATVIPNFVKIQYECIVWTSFIEQSNLIIEQFMYHNNSYWGNKDSMRYMVSIESFDNAVELTADSERIVKNTFSFEIAASILPDNMHNKIPSKIILKPMTISFTEHIVSAGVNLNNVEEVNLTPYLNIYDNSDYIINKKFDDLLILESEEVVLL